jgi:subtilisin family serine protease
VNHGYDFVDDDNDPMDLHGHGTHVAGTIGAVGNNSIGTVGLCWDVQIMAVRVFDAAGNSTTADIISGINYAVNNGAKILNMSFGGYNFDQAEYEAIGYAKNNDVIVVAAAGNNSTDSDTEFHHYPSDFDHNNIISVAALDQSYELASFSNYGNVSVDVGAPGTNIQSEWNGTEIIITDTLTSGWTEGGTLGWEYIVKDLGYGNENFLAVPFNWGPPSWGLYEANAYDRIWKTFNLSGYDGAILNYWFWLDLETGSDIYATYCDNGTSDPFFNGTQLAGWTGSTDGYFIFESYELPSNTITSTCTIGFALWSDDNFQQYGIATLDFSISAISLNDTSYGIINGTSMAAPHVTGLSALIWAFNPRYNYKEVIESIKDGGKLIQALDGKVSTGKAVNAWGSLRYITQPTGVTIINN